MVSLSLSIRFSIAKQSTCTSYQERRRHMEGKSKAYLDVFIKHAVPAPSLTSKEPHDHLTSSRLFQESLSLSSERWMDCGRLPKEDWFYCCWFDVWTEENNKNRSEEEKKNTHKWENTTTTHQPSHHILNVWFWLASSLLLMVLVRCRGPFPLLIHSRHVYCCAFNFYTLRSSLPHSGVVVCGMLVWGSVVVTRNGF